MKTYEFTLRFSLPGCSLNPEIYIQKLGECGCDDALTGVGKTGRIALCFARESTSAFAAISSAIGNVKKAIPAAKLIEASPDLVGLTEIADIIGCSRQNIRKIVLSNGNEFPQAAHEGKSSLWHLAKVLVWLENNKSYHIDSSLSEIAGINMQLNMARDLADMDKGIQQDILALVNLARNSKSERKRSSQTRPR